jgi:hypothetical protein
MTAFKILDWRPVAKNSLRGFAKVEMPSGMIISDVAALNGPNGPWASPPSKPMIGRDGSPMLDAKGKPRYSPWIEFRSKELRDRWSSAVVAALLEAYPDAIQ